MNRATGAVQGGRWQQRDSCGRKNMYWPQEGRHTLLWLCTAAGVLLLSASPVGAQSSSASGQTPVSAGVYAGAIFANNPMPRLAVSIDRGRAPFVVRGEAAVVWEAPESCHRQSRPERDWWQELSLGGRVVIIEDRWGPYVGVGAGTAIAPGTGDGGIAGMLYLEVGLVFEVAKRFALDLRGLGMLIAGGGEGFPFSSLNMGVRYRLSR